MPEALKAGFPTYWTSFGQGPRAALMIHCSLAHSGSWGGMARHLSGALTMTAFDLPGHGRSADWDERAEIQGLCVDIAAEFLREPTDIIGHSFGATVALRLAVARPDLVRSLTLIEPVCFVVAFHDQPSLRARLDARMADFDTAILAGDHASAAQSFLAVWGDRAGWEHLPETVRDALAAQMPVVAAGQPALHTDLAGMLRPGVLEALDIPVLVCEGSESPFIMSAITEGLAARLPRAERTILAGAGHMAPISHAHQTSAELLQFLRGC
jgi:pimeloyl-ACP methyl ester carboxylesterase